MLNKLEDFENHDSVPVILDDLELDRRQADAFLLWKELVCENNGKPLRKAFRPEKNRVSLPASLLIEVQYAQEGVKLIQRVEGRFVVMAFGLGRQKPLEEMYQDDFLLELVPRWRETSITASPSMTLNSLSDNRGGDFRFSRLILPLVEENGQVSRLYNVFSFEAEAVGRLAAPLRVQLDRRKRLPLGTGFYFDSKNYG